MKIGELDTHCGECDIIDFCGNAFGYCICNQDRFKDVDTETYKICADSVLTFPPTFCRDCHSDDCDDCENVDIARDCICEQVAEHVAVMLGQQN